MPLEAFNTFIHFESFCGGCYTQYLEYVDCYYALSNLHIIYRRPPLFTYENFMDNGVDRDTFLVGVGGGVVCDITGFAASTYLRGLRFGFVPTTLLAQADASVGGKNGINFKSFKNIIGTIRQPEFILTDFNFLRSLRRKDFGSERHIR